MIATLFLAAFTALPVQDGSGTIWGRVRSGSTGAPLAFATVEVISETLRPIRTETNAAGVYVLRDIPPGRRLIRASHIDHGDQEIEVMVVAGRRIPMNFELELRPVRLPVVLARAGTTPATLRDTVSVRPPDLGAAAVRAMEATPGVAEMGLADAAREVPGHEPIDPSDVLFVRGGSADLKLVLLNGAPVFAPFHIGGLIHAIDTDLYRSATLYLGGAPARYNGGLSYVMDLETRSGRETGLHGNLAVDMLAGKGVIEGPVTNRATMMFAGRGVHGQGTEPFVGDPFPYTYGDAIGRFDVDLSEGRVLSVTGFWNREAIQLDSLRPTRQDAVWGNTAGSVRLRTSVGKTDGLFTIAAGEFDAALPVGGINVLMTEGRSRHVRASADFGRSVGPGRINFGGSIDRMTYDQRVWTESDLRDSTLYAAGTAGTMAGAYIDAAANPFSRVQIRVGLRADLFTLDPSLRLSPRVMTTLLLTDRVMLTLAAGRYRQYVRRTQEPLALIVTPKPATGEQQHLAVASASHWMLSLDQDLGEGVRLSLEGFYKSYDDLPATTGTRAEAAGVDLWVRRNQGRLTGWFGYSLAWVWSDDDDPFDNINLFSGRRLLTAGLAGPLVGKGKFDVRVSYGAGLPFAAIPEPEAGTPVIGVGLTDVPAFNMAADPSPSLPSTPDEPYFRIDAQIARTWTAEWHGFNFQLTPYVKVLNALNRRDGIFYFYDRGTGSQAQAIASLPVLPVIGLDWRF